jgi:hypothetical protein
MLEPKTLKQIPIPDLSKIPSKTLRELLGLINRRLTKVDDVATENEIEKIVIDIYGLSSDERRSLGIGD